MSEIGTVYLVGAGPGDPGLITVKGLEVLRRANVIVYDRLAPAALLSNARDDAELISAAKAPGAAALSQAEINDLLVEHARQGKEVCRLKGGDPFVFGRGGEEAIALANAGIPFEVVPGITSAIGAFTYAGIPVTHRGITSSVTIVTGSEFQKPASSGVNWDAIAKSKGTIVILMGASRMGEIADELIAYGRSPNEPAAAVHRGTSSMQQTVVGTLSNINSNVERAGLRAPIALIVGDVVNLREEISWFDSRPLFNKRVLVTRARSQASRLASGLTELGATVVECPAIESVAVENTDTLDTSLRDLSRHEWIAFASPNGVNQVFARLNALGLDARAFSGCKVAAVGPATVAALQQRGIVANLTPDTYTAEGLVEKFRSAGMAPKSALVFKSDIGRETLPTGLRQLGAEVTEVAAYRTVLADDSAEIAAQAFKHGIDIVTFTSSSTVKNLRRLLGENVTSINNSIVACMGPVTAATAQSLGVRVDIIPEEQSIPGLISAIQSHFRDL